MAHHHTVFAQLLKLVPRHEFDALAAAHHQGRKLRTLTRWTPFAALSMARLGGCHGLRDIVYSLKALGSKLYHLGRRTLTRSSFSRVNDRQPYSLCEVLFARIYQR
jgi:putative transposase